MEDKDHGCRAGAECPFYHPPKDAAITNEPTSPAESAQQESQRSAVPSALNDRVVRRPVPSAQTDDPRAFQIGQIKRRFNPQVSDTAEVSAFVFSLKPSDPDFPYEIDALQCVLTVPKTYPTSGKPALQVTNNDIPRGFQINIERGFDIITSSNPGATLLGLMNRLDKELEKILAGRMTDTIKIVPNKATVKPIDVLVDIPKPLPIPRTSAPIIPPPPTELQRKEAEIKRQAHTRQLEARFGRLPSFAKSSDGLMYTLPLDSPKKSKWPVGFQELKTLSLRVPRLYPLEVATIRLETESTEARTVEKAFEKLPDTLQEPSLTQLANHLMQHIPELAKPVDTATTSPDITSKSPVGNSQLEATVPEAPAIRALPPRETIALDHPTAPSDDKPHVHFIPRPPEWTRQQTGDVDSETEDDSETDNSSDDHEEPAFPQAEAEVLSGPSAPQERGILLSFPQIELHGIELLELTSLNITVKCERCKDTMDVQRLRNYSGNSVEMRQETCKKCAQGLAIGFRTDLIHVNSARAGYLDLDGCTVIDMMTSTFIPTCAECSTAFPAPGVTAVRGDSSFAICRECHHKMTFRIVEVKFLHVSASAIRASKGLGRKKVKENLGITAGSELPRRGRCKHYSKSYRWFRFSCCSKVFACDRCHDEESDHPVEHANRMLCGFCSREQNFRPEDCGVCHAVLTGRTGSGFWEGGKGTRDPTRMSKKGQWMLNYTTLAALTHRRPEKVQEGRKTRHEAEDVNIA
ncbi:hypothetical protein LTR81_001458 [Elasticomyces elasticus]